jgi:hypothetical protein
MPEASQHRAWRYAHEDAAQRIDEFRDLLQDAVEEADDRRLFATVASGR